jgi:hypothetical protein
MTSPASLCRSLLAGDLKLSSAINALNRLLAGSYLSNSTACLGSPLERGRAPRRGAFSEAPTP